MKRTIFSFTAILALIASLGFGLYPEPSLSQGVPAATVGWYKLPSGTSPLILASCWNPVEGELYIVSRGQWDLNNLWLGSFNALGDFNGWGLFRVIIIIQIRRPARRRERLLLELTLLLQCPGTRLHKRCT